MSAISFSNSENTKKTEKVVESITATYHDFILDHFLISVTHGLRRIFVSYFNGIFPRMIFRSIKSGALATPRIKPSTLKDFVEKSTIDYFNTKYNINITYNPDLLIPIDIKMKSVKLPPLTHIQKERLIELWNPKIVGSSFENIVDNLHGVYVGMGGDSNFFSIPPSIIKTLGQYGEVHELFGSPFNTCVPKYSSAIPIEITYFSSKGSYHLYIPPVSGNPPAPGKGQILYVNPPFGEEITLEAAEFCIRVAHQCPEITVVFIIPDWPVEGYPARQRLDSMVFDSALWFGKKNYSGAFYDYSRDQMISGIKTVIYSFGFIDPAIILNIFNS